MRLGSSKYLKKMAKRKNFPKPLFLTPQALEYFKFKFFKNLRINFFSNNYVLISKNCLRKDIAYMSGQLNGTYVNEWIEEKEKFTIFIISELDFENAKKGVYSTEVNFVIININKRQSIIDEEKQKLSANIYIIRESIFYDFFVDRQKFIYDHKIFENIYNEENLFKLMSEIPKSYLF